MKILCISDHIDPIIYSVRIKSRYKDIDLVLSAGDLHPNYYDYIMSNLNKPLYFIYGNHKLNGIEYYEKAFRAELFITLYRKCKFAPGSGTHIDKRIINNKGLLIGGLGGSRWYNGGKNQFTEFGMAIKIIKILPSLIFNRILHGRFIDILLTHSPPYGIHDRKDRCHRGFKVFCLFIRLFKPRYFIHGHIHLYDQNEERIERFFNTDVINAYNHYIIDVQEKI